MPVKASVSHDDALSLLTENGQGHVLGFWKKLGDSQRAALLAQVGELDFHNINRMKQMLAAKDKPGQMAPFSPAKAVEMTPKETAAALKAGEDALRAGRVGVVLVAGGQGSRLGYEGPKGCFKVGPVSGASLFEIHSRKILALERQYGSNVPFYIMTSTENDAPTKSFFSRNNYFGLDRERVVFFTQGMWPALTPDGRIILDRPDHIFMSPDGHGGILSALLGSGAVNDMKARGLAALFYFQVDNPLVEIADPLFMGLHMLRKAQMSVKVCAKRSPDEPIGIVVTRGGRHAIVEYSELSKEQKHSTDPDGKLTFRLGSVAIHAFSLDFLAAQAAADLPLHMAFKKVPYCDAEGRPVKPDSPNAYKFEKFIFDALPAAERTVIMEFQRQDEFSPVKNASGEDSPDTCRRDMMRKSVRRLAAAGIKVPVDASGNPLQPLEIDPCFAGNGAELAKKLDRGIDWSKPVLLE